MYAVQQFHRSLYKRKSHRVRIAENNFELKINKSYMELKV